MYKAPSVSFSLLVGAVQGAVGVEPSNESHEFASIWRYLVDGGLVVEIEERDDGGATRWEVTFRTDALALDLLWKNRVDQLIKLVKDRPKVVLGKVNLFFNAFDGTDVVTVPNANTDLVWPYLVRAVSINRAEKGGQYACE